MLRIGSFGRAPGIWQKFTVWARQEPQCVFATWHYATRSASKGVNGAANPAQTANFCHERLPERPNRLACAARPLFRALLAPVPRARRALLAPARPQEGAPC